MQRLTALGGNMPVRDWRCRILLQALGDVIFDGQAPTLLDILITQAFTYVIYTSVHIRCWVNGAMALIEGLKPVVRSKI